MLCVNVWVLDRFTQCIWAPSFTEVLCYNTLKATTGLKYRIVPCMRPWALAAKPENWGWPLTRRRCLNGLSIPVQVPTPDPKLTDRRYRIDWRRSLPLLPFSGKRGQCSSRESCILLENEPTWSLVAMGLQCSSLAVHEFRIASEERCRWGYNLCVQTCSWM